MKLEGRDGEFIVIGENIHTTRVVLRKGRLVVKNPEGLEAVRYYDTCKRRRFLTIPDDFKRTQDYEEGRVKYVKIAVQSAMSGLASQADEGLAYLRRMVQRQVYAGADYLDLNVDEVSLRLDEQKKAMRWLVGAVQEASPVPISVDSSNVETIGEGLAACDGRAGRPLLNSASLERLEALDLALRFNARVVVTAAGESGMPQDAEGRVGNASRMVDAALSRGIAIEDIFVDALVFPISVDVGFGNHCFEAIRRLRAKFGPGIHVTGGFSNVSFGLPCRRLINDVFTILAVEAGADSGIVDPVASSPERVFAMDRDTEPYRLAEAMLLGRDRMCKAFLRAFRKGALDAYR
ncbi:MAG: dihydropteroate synthase [Gemmatimonadota bacterium]|nr:dihydropteroate synthase [Gemmatimonadota bacterium]